jgi:phosphatidylserine/phosphatidylglycerophosphate/cardiolipin synthase-like enzyme
MTYRRRGGRRTFDARFGASLVLAVAGAFAPAHAATEFPAAGTIELAFTPGDRIDTRIAAAIDGAQREVLVLVYSFTQPAIARALAAAHGRGVTVEVVADRGQTLELPQSAVPGLARAGVAIWLNRGPGAAHNKVVVIDADLPDATTITGSYNFTVAAQARNAENVVVLRGNRDAARAYRDYFRRQQATAQRWHGVGDARPAGR